jgi:nucleoside-diphosphate kinase
MERTFVAVKPDGVQREMIGLVITRFEEKGFQLIGLKMMQLSREQACEHYKEHQDKFFFEALISFITSGPLVAMVWQGEHIIDSVRLMVGATNGLFADPGTIRGDFSAGGRKNIVHASDSLESSDREISLFFQPEEIIDWEMALGNWIR